MPLCEGCNRQVESAGECPHCGVTVGTPATGNRRRDVGIGAAVVIFVSLGVLIPAIGVVFGWVFTLGGGLAGGATVGFLRASGGRTGAKYGAVVGVVGGVPSSIVGVTLGTWLSMTYVASQSTDPSGAGGWVIFAAIGLITGLFLKVGGAVVGGGLTGWLFED